MIQHVALFSFKEETSPKTLEDIFKELTGLKSIIKGIKSMKVGENFASRPTCYGYGLVTEFETKEDLEKYLSHPMHLQLLQKALPHISQFSEADFIAE